MDVRGSDNSNNLGGRDDRGQVLNGSCGGTAAYETKEETGYDDHNTGGHKSSDAEIQVVEQEIRVADEQCVRSRSSDEKSHEGCNVGEKKDDDSLDREKKRLCSDGQSSLPEISSDSSPRRGLDHCTTAPAGTIGSQGELLINSNEINVTRSKTYKESQRHDLKLDRLSELDKKNLIANLVKIQNDGTVEVDLRENTPVASELLELHAESTSLYTDGGVTSNLKKYVSKMKIAMLVVGTRGDVQPFLAVAKRLQEFGHHVRLATHINFRDFVKSAGVEFYPLGGDPRVLAGYMARNKGLIPSAPGEISIQRKQLKAIIESLLPACTEPNMESGVPFRAQAIIANPPAYGHAHVAEALRVPIHIFFTMPWTPTYEFPHPLARVPQSAANWLSYIIVDLMIWWGIRSYINDFRRRKLKLPPIAYFSMYYGSISHLPTGYMWSQHVVPKPKDWGPLVDVVGYCFLNLSSKYRPREEFVDWINKGPKPIYIGFGSMPLEDPRKTTGIILEALTDTGQRGILDRGWGDLGVLSDIPDHIFLLENCPHDWLFPQCSAVVHHGGAGTTATGLKAGCPTTVVPFFGDQFFWGDRIHQKGLGPEPIPIAQLSTEALSNAMRFMLQPEVKARVMDIAQLIQNEDGVAAAVDAFHQHLPDEPPMPPEPSKAPEDDHPNPIQWVFIQIGNFCCRACS